MAQEFHNVYHLALMVMKRISGLTVREYLHYFFDFSCLPSDKKFISKIGRSKRIYLLQVVKALTLYNQNLSPF